MNHKIVNDDCIFKTVFATLCSIRSWQWYDLLLIQHVRWTFVAACGSSRDWYYVDSFAGSGQVARVPEGGCRERK